MPRSFSELQRRGSSLIQYLNLLTLGDFLLLLAACVFIYLVSPLRDPSFQPNSANAGTLIPWLRGIDEGTWILGASIFANLLTANLMVIFWRWIRSKIRRVPQFLRFVFWIVSGCVIGTFLHYSFVIYLLQQWIID